MHTKCIISTKAIVFNIKPCSSSSGFPRSTDTMLVDLQSNVSEHLFYSCNVDVNCYFNFSWRELHSISYFRAFKRDIIDFLGSMFSQWKFFCMIFDLESKLFLRIYIYWHISFDIWESLVVTTVIKILLWVNN
jgi:hypothetical protein